MIYQNRYRILFLLLFVNVLSLAQEVALKKKEQEQTIKTALDQAVHHFENTHFDKALRASKAALIKSFEINSNSYIAQSYNTIGVIYDECNDSKRAIEFYEKALRFARQINNDTLNNWIYNNLGSAYYFNNIDTDKGISYYKKALYFAKKLKDENQIIHINLNLASAYLATNEDQKADSILKTIKEAVFKNNTDEIKLSYYVLMGIKNTHDNKKENAEEFYFKAKDLAEKNHFSSNLLNVYENLAKHFGYFNEQTKQEHYDAKHDSLYNVIYSDEKMDSIEKQALDIELDEYKIQLEKVELQSEKNSKIVETSKLVLVLFMLIVITLLLLLLTLYKSIKTREKLNLELKNTNEALSIAKEKAEEASQMKTQFVSTITHELRTPLYGVIGITNILLDEHKELANSPHLNSLKFSAKYLLSLVNDILQISKIEERKVVLENLIFNLTDEIDGIRNSIEYIAERNNNKLIIEIDTAIPEFLIGDKLRLSQIIMNLVSNSLKFTKNGEVIITADLERVEDTMYYITFKVIDNGVGIAKEHQQVIFDKFVQIERKEEDYQGTGLGLSIVTSLIKLFKSEIHLESEENVGTSFTFTIGFIHDEKQCVALINEIEVDLSSHHTYTILVIEDNKINQLVTKKIIQNSNLTCTIVDDGYAALVALEREHFDLILMDINMPLINGFDTTRKIREKGYTMPIIALTAFDKQEVSEEVYTSGMNDILIKPFEPTKLYQIISTHIPKKESDD
ncbi:MAG: response regulator [Flavobacterium sp.]|uniref:response regulator n=1 Tax=Flavobacterium sp. TaxID=239 RepID=UPI00352831FE